MQKVFFYLTLVIVYLGLSKALSPTELGMYYLPNEKSFGKIINGENVTAILSDMHATGFIIQTYYQKFRVIHGFQSVEEIIVRTSRDFALRNKKNIGMSLFRRHGEIEDTTPMPPGTTFIGNREYGEWRKVKSGKSYWRFYRAYKNLPRYLGWGIFRPDSVFYEQQLAALERQKPFYGPKNEFGENGWITKKNFPHFFQEERHKKVSIRGLLTNYIRENF